MINSISIAELLRKVDANVIDIRDVQSYNNNHLPNASNIPSEILISNPSKYLDKSKTYYLYCKRGITSMKTCTLLNSLGYKTVNIIGGYEAWILNK